MKATANNLILFQGLLKKNKKQKKDLMDFWLFLFFF